MIGQLYDKKEVAGMLHCSVSKIEKMMRARTITFLKIGALVRFRQIDIEDALTQPPQTRFQLESFEKMPDGGGG